MRRQPLDEGAAVHNKANGGKVPVWLAEVRRLNGSARAEVERLFLTA
jgi:hypothetical protein